MNKIILCLFAVFLLLGSSSAQKKNIPNINLPRPIEFPDMSVGGELLIRAMKNFDRLESEIYQPENVFIDYKHSTPDVWAGDKEGRIILGLVLEARATHRTPLYLEKIIQMLPKRMNAKGYLGQIYENTIDEQQLSGHGWLLRGLCEYYEWKKDPEVKKYIINIIKNLALPTKGFHKNYPIDPENRIKNTGEMTGTSQNLVNGWNLSSDVGCDFIFMDGVVHAYSLFPSLKLKTLIDEMITRFFEMDVVAIKAQTHATLTGLRAVLRYYAITGDKELLKKVVERYQLYRDLAITENYENYNWFERPEWTEPCAIIDSYLLSVQLWQYTQNQDYVEDAQHIYYNAICHTQRSNGGFGCDNCPGPIDNFIKVNADEAYWCCTMRGGEGLAKAIQYNFFQNADTIIVSSFNTSKATFKISDKNFAIEQETQYPFANKVNFRIDNLKRIIKFTLKLFVPGWIKNVIIYKNGNRCDFTNRNGFVIYTSSFQTGDNIEFSFEMNSGIESIMNSKHSRPGYVRLFYGPLLLGYVGDQELSVTNDTKIIKTKGSDFSIKDEQVILSPVYHLMDSKVCQNAGYKKQILFKLNNN